MTPSDHRCWESVIATDTEYERLGGPGSWVLDCVLSGGHEGLHHYGSITAGAGPRAWLRWADGFHGERVLLDLAPCPYRGPGGSDPCGLFDGHPGGHMLTSGSIEPLVTPPATEVAPPVPVVAAGVPPPEPQQGNPPTALAAAIHELAAAIDRLTGHLTDHRPGSRP